MKYFEEIFKGKVTAPSGRTLEALHMITIPHFNGKGCRPYIEVIEIKDDLITQFSAKDHPNLKKYSDESHKI